MKFQWVNKFNLPAPIVALITEDYYHKKRDDELRKYCSSQGLDVKRIKHFSVNDLIKPPRMRILTNRHAGEVIKDVASDIYRILGQAVHRMLWEAAKMAPALFGYQAEERMFIHFQVDGQTVVISGEPDLVSPEHVIDDYKVVAVYSWTKAMKEGAKSEWAQQLNLYAYIRLVSKGLVTLGLRIISILRDFNLNETVQEGYPPAGAQVIQVPVWQMEEAKAFLEERVKLHLSHEDTPDQDLPECTAYEMWEKPNVWAVQREGAARSAKNHSKEKYPEGTTEEFIRIAAHADMEERNKSLKRNKAGELKEKPYLVEFRPGERTRCLRFCDARIACSQFQEYASATFKEPKPSPQPVENV